MTTDIGAAQEEMVAVGETQLHLLKGGAGRPALVLHGLEGPEGWLAFHEALSGDATVYAPSHPGFGLSPRPAWLESIAHQALFYGWFIQEAGLGEVDLIGCGVGGWIAAQMAATCPHNLRHLVLVDAAGIRPEESETLDIFLKSWAEVIATGYHDAASSAEYERVYSANPIVNFGGPREAGRSMTMRMCYRPYMYDPSLPGTLGRVKVPTLVVWGADDKIIPVECGRLYQQAIPGARLEVIDGCGHFAQYERPDELARLVRQFIAS